MANAYCEKHEWPGGMPTPCPDCIEWGKVTAERDRWREKATALKDAVIRLSIANQQNRGALSSRMIDAWSEVNQAIRNVNEPS